jgi:Siphovirus Gp157
MNIHANVQFLQNQISDLLLQYPELADDEDFRADVFEGETALEYVLTKLVAMSRDASTMADAIKLRMGDLSERKARFDRKEEAARKLIMSVMERADLSKLQLVEATLSMRQLPPSPIVTDETVLPDNCVRIERKPDMKAIKAEIDGGRDVPGVAMSNGKPSLTIRVK